jgi:hypothetical protein
MNHFASNNRESDKERSWKRCLDDALTSMQIVFDSQAVQVTFSRTDIVCKLFEMEIGPVDLGPTTFKRVR